MQRFLRYWHTRFNKLAFSSELTRARIVVESCAPDAAGYCEATSPVCIYIDPTLTREEARQVLLHEMIHQWQHENGYEMNHGPTFQGLRNPCELLTGCSPWPSRLD